MHSTHRRVYGVATEAFSLTDIRPNWADVDLSLTVGYGNGLFSDDGGLPVDAVREARNGGLFYGGKVDFNATPNLGVTLMAENNAWDLQRRRRPELSRHPRRASTYRARCGFGRA